MNHTVQVATTVREQLNAKKAIIDEALAILDSIDTGDATLSDEDSNKVQKAAELRDAL